ncbi:hypothetical protein D3C83_69650 [compost metagenome]
MRAERLAGELVRAIGDHLVGVHVALRARAGLPDDEGEVVVELAGDDFVGGLDDEVGDVLWQLTELGVGLSGALLEDAEGADDGAAPDEGVAADGEVVD